MIISQPFKNRPYAADFGREGSGDRAVATRVQFQLYTMPGTEEYAGLMRRIFTDMGEGSRVEAPVTVVRPQNVKIGRNVVVMPGCLMMSAGGITIIDDGAMLAANVQIISNNHDLHERHVITCLPVHIGKGAWIGAARQSSRCHGRRQRCGGCRECGYARCAHRCCCSRKSGKVHTQGASGRRLCRYARRCFRGTARA